MNTKKLTYTDEVRRIIHENYAQRGTQFCANLLGCTCGQVAGYASHNNLKVDKSVTEEIKNKIRLERTKNYKFNPNHFLNITDISS